MAFWKQFKYKTNSHSNDAGQNALSPINSTVIKYLSRNFSIDAENLASGNYPRDRKRLGRCAGVPQCMTMEERRFRNSHTSSLTMGCFLFSHFYLRATRRTEESISEDIVARFSRGLKLQSDDCPTQFSKLFSLGRKREIR